MQTGRFGFSSAMGGSKTPLTIPSCRVRRGSIATLGFTLEFSEYSTLTASGLLQSLARCLTRQTRQRCSGRRDHKCFLQDVPWKYLCHSWGITCGSQKLSPGVEARQSGQCRRSPAQQRCTSRAWRSPHGSTSQSVPVLWQP